MILDAIDPQPSLRVPLDDALGMVLAEEVVSPLDLPPWTNSAMDGYAVRSEDVRGASASSPRTLSVIERIPAGQVPVHPLARDAGAHVRHAGEDIRRGTAVCAPGTELGPAHLGLLASLAVSHPLVVRRPRVAILAGGDEIADLDQRDEILAGRKIGSSNTHALLALVRTAGGEPVSLGIASDAAESVRDHLDRSRDADLLVTTAGVSVGEHDHVRSVIESMGGAITFWRLPIRPGATTAFGRLGAIPWLGLPGNPVSTMVTFELFVRPAIRRLAGHRLPFRRTRTARLAEPIHLKARLQHFLRGIAREDRDGGTSVRLTGPQGSGRMSSMVAANALIVVPEGVTDLVLGAEVRILPLDEERYGEHPEY
jgi:molybdopterin molybdotransferase